MRVKRTCLSCGTSMQRLATDLTKTVAWGCPECKLMLGYRRGTIRWWYSGGSSISVVPAGCVLVVPEVPLGALRVSGQGKRVSEGLVGCLEGSDG